MPTFPFRRLLLLVALGTAVLGGCALPPPTDSNPLNKFYRCDRNGDLEQRQAC